MYAIINPSWKIRKMANDEKVSAFEAFKAMKYFLEKYYEQTRSSDVGSLLGGLQILEDNTTADPAAWSDWMDAVSKIGK